MSENDELLLKGSCDDDGLHVVFGNAIVVVSVAF